MKSTFKQRFWKFALRFFFVFLAMFVFRFIYGYVADNNANGDDGYGSFFSNIENLRKNYASEKKFMKGDVAQQVDYASGQKYEKTASVKSKTSQFDKDVSAVKDQTKGFEGVIQYEKNTGNNGYREIHLSIGVSPEKFDDFYLKIQEIGVVKSKEVTKVDKTNEFRQLNAKKKSLEKTLSSLNELKSRGGAIGDYVELHDKILSIETTLQELGVELGNFDAENEFCTVRFSLHEGATGLKISFIHRVKVALEWTIKYFAVLVFTFLGLSIMIFVLLLIIDKLNILKAITGKLTE